MSILSNKYNIPEETVKKMIQDGVVSACWPMYDDIIALKKQGKSCFDIAVTLNISTRYVYKVLNKVN